MDHVQTIDDIKKVYVEFLYSKQNPQLINLSNWGKNRYFLSKYFKVISNQYKNEKISIVFNNYVYCLDTRHAPDFMDQENYIQWLENHLLK